ncbi:MAG: polysaccharide chain length determinant protein (PEP-CTERM system associated) [Oceanicoccus sp.]|jgi:polysaccharide chain length determinant protein (PEP-CTERM system associated)
METRFLLEILRAVGRELVGLRGWVVGLFVVLTFCVLAVGLVWPERYETSSMLYADVTNIIEPLLEGRAEVTEIDRSSQARELIYTRKIMLSVAEETGLTSGVESPKEIEEIIKYLREDIKIFNEGGNYFRVSYKNSDQALSFDLLSSVVAEFISNASEQRRNESRGAYEFIEAQVVTYKNQLVRAENQLKGFKAKNLDGDQRTVNARIGSLREQIEELGLTVGEIESRRRFLVQQLKQENKFLNVKGKVNEERDRLYALKERLNMLRLSYLETYPDIITLKQQITGQELVIESMQGGVFVSRTSSTETEENPLYNTLRTRLSETEISLGSQQKRLESLERLLLREHERAGRVASKEAEMAELTRDYDVTRDIYEEMLGRKEKARLSMTLDVEGQGVSFKIQEPAVFPVLPSGISFLHFVFFAPILSLMAVVSLVTFYVFVDPRLRSPSLMMSGLPENIELLAVIPHVSTRLTKRIVRSDVVLLFSVCVVSALLYIAVVWSRFNGYF